MSDLQMEWFNCECGDNHHAVRLIYDPDEGEVFFEFRVNNYKNFWQRLRAAMKYLFNLDNRDASYDTMIVRKDEAQKMIRILQKVTKENE
jgi:ATP-dependent Clp protease ATP-binding subunit ClpA